MEEDTTTMIFRIEKDLKTAFDRAAKARDQTSSQLLRAFIRHTVEEHDKKHAQGDMFIAAEPKPAAQKKPKKPPKSPAASMMAKMKKGSF